MNHVTPKLAADLMAMLEQHTPQELLAAEKCLADCARDFSNRMIAARHLAAALRALRNS